MIGVFVMRALWCVPQLEVRASAAGRGWLFAGDLSVALTGTQKWDGEPAAAGRLVLKVWLNKRLCFIPHRLCWRRVGRGLTFVCLGWLFLFPLRLAFTMTKALACFLVDLLGSPFPPIFKQTFSSVARVLRYFSLCCCVIAYLAYSSCGVDNFRCPICDCWLHCPACFTMSPSAFAWATWVFVNTASVSRFSVCVCAVEGCQRLCVFTTGVLWFTRKPPCFPVNVSVFLWFSKKHVEALICLKYCIQNTAHFPQVKSVKCIFCGCRMCFQLISNLEVPAPNWTATFLSST